MESSNRRNFIKKTSLGIGTTFLGTSLTAALPFPNIQESGKQKKLGIALVGLGGYAMGQFTCFAANQELLSGGPFYRHSGKSRKE